MMTMATRSNSALELTLSQAFCYLGDLAMTCVPDEQRLISYIVAVSLHDLSLWLIYSAWDHRYPVDDDLGRRDRAGRRRLP